MIEPLTPVGHEAKSAVLMSWQTYVDDNLVGTGKIIAAAIIGHDGNVWACSPDFNPLESELSQVINAFTNPTQIRSSGLFVEKHKYIPIRTDSNSIYSRGGPQGMICVKTGQTVLLAKYLEPPVSSRDVALIVEGLGDYLRSVGF